MKSLNFRRPFWLTTLVFIISSPAVRADVIDYVKTPDPAFSWKLVEKKEVVGGTVYDLHLVSQVWQGIKWEHQLQVYLPKNVAPTKTLFLWNTGGKADPDQHGHGHGVGRQSQCPGRISLWHSQSAALGRQKGRRPHCRNVCALPANEGRKLAAFVSHGEESIPSHGLALQAFRKQEWKIDVTHFVVSGASSAAGHLAERGQRPAASRPWRRVFLIRSTCRRSCRINSSRTGKYSDMIADYTKRGLVPLPDTEDARKLWAMVDPWVYRARLKQPTMIINGTNDPYWTQDAR